MKKRNLVLCILLTVCMLVVPSFANAATVTIFGASDAGMSNTTLNGNTVEITNEGANTKIYLGVGTDGTEPVKEYKATLKLKNSNYSFRSALRQNNWVGNVYADETDPTIIYIDLKNNTGVTGEKNLVATINLTVANNTPSDEKCTIELSQGAPVTTPTNPKCAISGNKYYCANGEECTKAEYEAACTPQDNPQTGSFLPYAIIIGGITVAAGLYMVTKKNKIYHM